MAFGNPYGDEWSVDEIVAAVACLSCRRFARFLSPTRRAGAAEKIQEVVSAVMAEYGYLELESTCTAVRSGYRQDRCGLRRWVPAF